MSDLHVRYLLVGGGVAASHAAQEIRRLDANGELLLVGQENTRPYHRPPLSKEFLLGRRGHEELFTHPAEWFVEHRVRLRTSQRVSRLDIHRHSATLANGEEISFDHLLIATGGGAKRLSVPGAALPNLLYLRTLEDAERLGHAMDKARREGRPHPDKAGRGRAVVIGAGVLGLEIAGTLSTAGLHVDLAVAGEHPWDHLAGETTGKALARFLGWRGVAVHLNSRAVRLEGDGRVQRVILACGGAVESLECDFAVAAVGLEVHKEILRGTPIIAEKAILVDQRCRTNIGHIYAAGDCAAIFDPLFGKHRLLDHWDSAALTGRIAGANMAGMEASFDAVSHFESRVADLELNVWGEGKIVDRRIVRGSAGAPSPRFVEFGVAADGRVAQIITVGPPTEADILPEFVRRRLRIDGNEERLKDPAVPLRELLGPDG
ncbi:MAG: FAD-dependent oxidoreductase [Tepidisphaeraceae bacterium]|jgi:NADPH-dependent 2,4-dienoyl-CoA reductase/sulfur reductase-like enzyme